MDLGLRGRNAVVLGGTRGIGRAIAETLAGEGAGVAVCARNADQVASTVAELKAKGVVFKKAPTKEFYGFEALFVDDSGNWFSLSQAG